MGTLFAKFRAFARTELPPWVTGGERVRCERAYVAGAAEVLALVDALTEVDALVRSEDPAWRAIGDLADQVAAYRKREGWPAPRKARKVRS